MPSSCAGPSRTAARLVQTALERSQLSWHLGGQARLMLQLALNLLRRPDEGRVHMLGLA